MILRKRLTASVVTAAFVAVFVAGPVFAQQPQPQNQNQNTVAKLKDIEGNVLVSEGDAMVAGADDRRLRVGTRVVTTAGAKVTINYDVGCDITLKENQRFTVTAGPCAVLLAQVENLGPAAGAIGGEAVAGAAGGNVGTIVGVGVLAAALVGGVVAATRKNPVSPS